MKVRDMLTTAQASQNWGQAFVRSGLITKDQLAIAEVTSKTLGGELSSVLIQKGFLKEEEVLNFISKESGKEIIQLDVNHLDRSLLRYLPFHLAKKFHVFPYSLQNQCLSFVVSDPSVLPRLEENLSCGGLKIDFVLALRSQIEQAIRQGYQIQKIKSQDSDKVEIITEENKKPQNENQKQAEEMASSAGVVTTVNSILETAYQEKASDIHIEPQENFIRVRLRIDGVLEEKHILPLSMLLPIVSRIKIISSMNIAEKRSPQDGRFSVRIQGNSFDCRTSTYPTVFGEKIVIRLLSKGNLKKLEQLGLNLADREKFKSWILRPHGVIFVTGPTGSGKSTTLYSCLQLLNSIDRNIMSIEDPVENEIIGVNQGQLNTKANMTFASAMRSMLRQDPDVIMVGEVRDAETAEMALRAALTGHLVLSTLHTNTALGAISRLMNLGMPPFLVASALIGVLGQRLVRKICADCIQVCPEVQQDAKLIGLSENDQSYMGKGCAHCRQTGYTSRIGIYELLSVTPALRELIEKSSSEETLLKQAQQDGYKKMIEDGCTKVKEGMTTVAEVLRVTEIF